MYKQRILTKVIPYKVLGYRILDDGTELFGNDKEIAPQAWLHQIFPALNENEIVLMENMLQKKMPNSLIDFYSEMNGLRTFVTKFSISGLRKDIVKGIESTWQPFSIETENNKERPFNAKKEDIFFGFYSKSGNLAYINSKTEKVFISSRYNASPIKMYNNLYDFFCEEIENMFSIYGTKYFPSQQCS